MPEQLPADVYLLGGQPNVAGFKVREADVGRQDDAEDYQGPAGQHAAKVVFSRRATKSIQCETTDGDPDIYIDGGALDASFVPTSTALDMVWKITDVSVALTRGVTVVSLDLIALTDSIT